MRYLVAGIFFFQNTNIYAQVMLDREINITVTSMSLDEVLDKIQQEYYILFSYGFDNATGSTPISIQANHISIYRLLYELARQANLEFIIVGTTVVFRRATTFLADKATLVEEVAIACLDSARMHKYLQRTVVFPLRPVKRLKYIHTPIVIRSANPRRTNIETYSRLQVRVKGDLDCYYVSKSPMEANYKNASLQRRNRIAADIAYQLSPRMVVCAAISSSFKGIATQWNNETTASGEYSLAFAYTFFRTSKTLVGLSTTLSYSIVSQMPITFQDYPKVYMPFLPLPTSNYLYSGAVCFSMDQQIGDASGITVRGRYGVYDARKSEDNVSSTLHVLSLNVGFRYTLTPHQNKFSK